jgi:hypothetical protein
MKYIPVSRDIKGSVIPYVYYNVSEARYKLADREMVEESIETVFDMEVLPSTFIPVSVKGKPMIVKAVLASTYYTMLSTAANSPDATFSLDRNEAGLVQVITMAYNNHTTLLNNQSIIYLTNDLTERHNTFYILAYIVTNILHIIANYILIYSYINCRYLFNYILLKYLILTLPILSILLYNLQILY